MAESSMRKKKRERLSEEQQDRAKRSWKSNAAVAPVDDNGFAHRAEEIIARAAAQLRYPARHHRGIRRWVAFQRLTWARRVRPYLGRTGRTDREI